MEVRRSSIIIRTIFLALAVVGLCFSTACKNNNAEAANHGTEAASDPSLVVMNEDYMYIRPFGGIEPDSIYGDVEATKAKLIEICETYPEALAAVMSAFPDTYSYYHIHGCEDGDEFGLAQAIDRGYDEGGEEFRQELLASLKYILNDAKTTVEFTRDSIGYFDVTYLCARDIRKPLDSKNLCLLKVPCYLNGDEILKITTPCPTMDGGSPLTGYFLIQGGFQRIMDMSYAP